MRELHRNDAGTSLLELLVGMVVMTIFMSIFTGVVVSLAKTTTKIEAVTTSAAQVNNAFLALDKTIRYATAITTPGPDPRGARADVYVELGGTRARVPADGTGDGTSIATCTQLRVHFDPDPTVAVQKLQTRTWDAATTPASPFVWTTLASNITNGAAVAPSADRPFTTPAVRPGAATSFQRLAVTLVAGTSGPSSTSTTRTSIAFTALNSSSSDPTDVTSCQRVRP